MTTLKAPKSKISDLTGLEYAINLKVLKLARNQITDISPLTGLTKLKELGLYKNRVTNIRPLEHLTNLQQLNLHGNNITNIIPLVGNAANNGLGTGDTVNLRGNPLDSDAINNYVSVLEQYGVTVQWDPPDPASNVVNIPDPALRARLELSLYKEPGDPITQAEMETLTRFYPSGRFSDLTGLEYAINLTFLGFDRSAVNDISPIGKLTKLTSLHISVNTTTDLSPLSKLTNLQTLSLTQDNITDISALAGLTKLTWLQIRNNVSGRSSLFRFNISSLAGLTNLQDLRLSQSNISNISALAGLTNLQQLSLMNNRISDISALAGLTNLKKLYLSGNGISDISSLGGLTNLTLLLLDGNEIEDISPVAGLTNLTLLGLSNNDIIDILPVAGLTNLEGLYLNDNSPFRKYYGDNRSLTDISAVARLTKLERLSLASNNISDISPLSRLTNLTNLVLANNSITDISVIARFTKMQDLWLQDNSITDISPLVANTGLGRGDRLLVWGNPLDTDSINTHIPALKSRGVDLTFEGTSAAPSIARPVLALNGAIVDQRTQVNRAGFRVTVKNLSNDRAAMTIDTDGQGYQLKVEVGKAGNILLISAQSPDPSISVKPLRYTLTAEDVLQGWIQLPALVAYEMPKETELLANYPNPFNPETWIPYRLAEDADVKLTIYDSKGRVVRSIDVGYQVAGVYENRSRAVYFDGRNASGEPVSSGVYFYHLSAGDYSATRRMLILK